MGISKDKRIKKLKKQRIWPSILGLVLLVFTFSVIIKVVMEMACLDIVQRKLSDCHIQSEKIASLYEGYTEENESIDEKVLSYIDLSMYVEAVLIKNSNGEKIWSSSEQYQITDDLQDVDFIQINETSKVAIIIHEDNYQFLNVDKDGNIISENLFDKILAAMHKKGDNVTLDDSEAIMEAKLWFVVPIDQQEVFVLNNISIYSYDLFMFIASMVLFVILIVIFAVYYIVSFISVVVSMRKATNIIYTDVVTGGNNWLHFVRKGTTLLKRNSGKYNYAMLHLKMRKYRSFCTCLGVREGEELIEKFYNVLKKKITKKEVMAHHENAEFGVLVTYTDREQLLSRIAEMEKAMDAVLSNMKLYFGVGVYYIVPGEKDVEQLYNNASIACEMLGEEAENQVAFFDVEMNKQRLWERKVEDDMDRALANREFKVYLQPKISAQKEELAGAEALVRWIHPVDGFIPPNKFIPIFENNGFILKLDDYMLEEIAKQQAEWIASGREIVPISVNISRAHFTREDLAQHICSIVDKYNIPHNVIELELTESAFFDDKKVLLNTVKELRESGFVVSMDDFGAGYSSLNSLKELHIDVLKIDADFFRGIEAQERGMLIVSEVIDLAKKLNMKIVAEGIESREQVDFLVEQECDLIQGYFFAKPMPIDEFVEKYKET